MAYKLFSGQRNPAVSPIKKWLNILVTPNPGLAENEFYDANMWFAVKQFQAQNGSPNPHGNIDDVTLYNILTRTGAGEIDDALSRNAAFNVLVSNMVMPYDDEVHEDLTFALAVAAGFEVTNAGNISNFDVKVDYNADTKPLPPETKLGKLKDIGSGANYRRLRDWHFVSPKRLKQLDDRWRSSGTLKDLGMYMHTFQDSFSHIGLNAVSGQLFTRVNKKGKVERSIHTTEEEWHQVDDPSKRPELALSMAKQSYDTLVEAVPICLQKDPKRDEIKKTYAPIPWADIFQEVKDFCYEKDVNRRKVKVEQLGTRLVQNQYNSKSI